LSAEERARALGSLAKVNAGDTPLVANSPTFNEFAAHRSLRDEMLARYPDMKRDEYEDNQKRVDAMRELIALERVLWFKLQCKQTPASCPSALAKSRIHKLVAALGPDMTQPPMDWNPLDDLDGLDPFEADARTIENAKLIDQLAGTGATATVVSTLSPVRETYAGSTKITSLTSTRRTTAHRRLLARATAIRTQRRPRIPADAIPSSAFAAQRIVSGGTNPTTGWRRRGIACSAARLRGVPCLAPLPCPIVAPLCPSTHRELPC